MQLEIKLNSYHSNDLMQREVLSLDTMPRPCPLGDDPDAFILVKIGNVEMSYSPQFSHYYFSRVPNAEWFSRYYSSTWMMGKGNAVSKFKTYLRSYLSFPYRYTRKLTGFRYSDADRAVDADIERYFLLLKPYLKRNGKVLDLGAGTGDFLVPYRNKRFARMGIEPSKMNGALAKLRGMNMLCSTIADSPAVRSAIRSASVVFSNHSLEHHYDPTLLLRLCKEELAEGSILSLTVPNADTDFLFHQHLYFLHLDNYTERSLETLLNQYGFRVILKEIGSQLRFVAIRDNAVMPIQHSPEFDKNAFVSAYIHRFYKQISGIKNDEALKSINDVRFGYIGARPFTGISYNAYHATIPSQVKRFAHVNMIVSEGTGSAVLYECDNDKTIALLK